MIITRHRITIIRTAKPRAKDVNDELRWFGQSLGLFSERDKDSSLYRMFVELIKSTRRGQALSSDELAYRLNLSRGTVVHHLNKLLESGIIVSEHNKYALRVANLEILVDELKRDLRRTMENLTDIAKQLDEELGL